MANGIEGNGSKFHGNALPEDPEAVARKREELANRLHRLKTEHPDAMGDAFYNILVQELQDSKDLFALKNLERDIAVREDEHRPVSAPTEPTDAPRRPGDADAREDTAPDSRQPKRKLMARMGDSGVEVKEDYGQPWRKFSNEEADAYLDWDQWRRRHPNQTPPPDAFPIDFKMWTDEDEERERQLAGASRTGPEPAAHSGPAIPPAPPSGPRPPESPRPPEPPRPLEPQHDAARERFEAAGGGALDPKKFKRIRDIGPGGRWKGFGTPRRFFYIHPDGPKNPDGSPKRFTVEEVEAYKKRYTGGPESGPTVQQIRNAPGGGAPERLDFNPRDYIGIRPKSLQEIAANERDSQFFGEMLASLAPGKSADMLARAYHTGNLTDEERQIVLHAQYEYAKYSKKWEEMSAKVGRADIERAMKRNPMLEAAVRTVSSDAEGYERILGVWKEELLHLAMRDRGAFDEVYEAQMTLAKLQETRRYKNWDAEVAQVCKKAKIDPADYDAVFNMKTRSGENESRQWVKMNIQKDLTGFARVVGALGITRFRANRVMKRADMLDTKLHKHWASPTSWVLSDINTHMGTLTRTMALTIGEPEKLRALTMAAMRNEAMRLERDAGPKSKVAMGEEVRLRGDNKALSKEKLQILLDRDMPPEIRAKSKAEREHWRDTVWDPPELRAERQEGERRMGIWAQIANKLAEWLFGERKKELSVGA